MDAPRVCGNGHRLGPNRALVDAPRCRCDKAVHGGHNSWTCRVCGHVIYSDGHVDNSKLVLPPPALTDAVRID